MADLEIPQDAAVLAPVSQAHLLLALTAIILPFVALSMEEGFAISAVPRAVASLNGFDRCVWPSTSFLLISTIAMPVFAKLSDLYGRKWFYFFSAVSSIAYPLLCGAAGVLPIPLDGMDQIILASGFLGFAHGGIMVLSFTLVADLFPPSERGRYQGILAAASTLPFIVGQLGRLDYGPLVLALGLLRQRAARRPGNCGRLLRASRRSAASGSPRDRLGRDRHFARLVGALAARADLGGPEQLVGGAHSGAPDRVRGVPRDLPAG
jgi:MFS family permease